MPTDYCTRGVQSLTNQSTPIAVLVYILLSILSAFGRCSVAARLIPLGRLASPEVVVIHQRLRDFRDGDHFPLLPHHVFRRPKRIFGAQNVFFSTRITFWPNVVANAMSQRGVPEELGDFY